MSEAIEFKPEWKAATTDRICETCNKQDALEVKLTATFEKDGYEYKCPRCGSFETWLGLRPSHHRS